MSTSLLSHSPAALAQLVLPVDASAALLVGRVWSPRHGRPVPVVIRNGVAFDLSSVAATAAQVLMRADKVRLLREAPLPILGAVDEILWNSFSARRDGDCPHVLAPCDLQPVKACGVTYIASVLERLVEERSGGDPSGIDDARRTLEELVGVALNGLEPGSTQADALKRVLVDAGQWSHYLEVAIGPDAESFSKCPPMAAVGFGADVGIRSDSRWNNPEPELVLAVDPCGEIVGVTLGNDVNLRDFEGRSPMLLDKAKDNNASAAIGPFIRLFDESYGLEEARRSVLEISIDGADGYCTQARGDVSDITRPLEELVRQVMGRHHQYPDGLMLFTGTMWTPLDDRIDEAKGFCHRDGDYVTIGSERVGVLCNRTRPAEECAPWTFGLAALIDRLASA